MQDKNHNILVWPGGKLVFSDGCIIMGVLNVTPDSFSDGGDFFDTERAIERGIEMAQQGAAIIDIGAESTHPDSQAVGPDEQIKRAIPVIEKLAAKIKIPISIDSKDYEVAKAALDAGASMINDITALSDSRTAQIAAEEKVPIVLMHMQGSPDTMQKEPEYKNVVGEVLNYLLQRAQTAQEAGIEKEKIFIDPE